MLTAEIDERRTTEHLLVAPQLQLAVTAGVQQVEELMQRPPAPEARMLAQLGPNAARHGLALAYGDDDRRATDVPVEQGPSLNDGALQADNRKPLLAQLLRNVPRAMQPQGPLKIRQVA